MHHYTEVIFACRRQCVRSSLLACLLHQGAVEDVSGDEALSFGDPELTVEQRGIVGDGRMWRQHLVAKEGIRRGRDRRRGQQ